MAKSFQLESGADGDGTVTLLLILLAAVLSYVNLWITISGVTLTLGPAIAFLVTRAAYKSHYRRLMKRLAFRDATAF